jgi:hypothetical protein
MLFDAAIEIPALYCLSNTSAFDSDMVVAALAVLARARVKKRAILTAVLSTLYCASRRGWAFPYCLSCIEKGNALIGDNRTLCSVALRVRLNLQRGGEEDGRKDVRRRTGRA